MDMQVVREQQAESLKAAIEREERFVDDLVFYNQKFMRGLEDVTDLRRAQALNTVIELKKILALYG